MQIKEASFGDLLVISLTGSLDPDGAIALKAFMQTALARQPQKLLFDLSQLDYTGSAGLREFFLAAKNVGRTGGKMAAFGMKKEVAHVFELAGFATTYPTAPTLAEALEALA
ncbi:MAG: STAS domain-containing protein [Verrucomicrobiia bacterium]